MFGGFVAWFGAFIRLEARSLGGLRPKDAFWGGRISTSSGRGSMLFGRLLLRLRWFRGEAEAADGQPGGSVVNSSSRS